MRKEAGHGPRAVPVSRNGEVTIEASQRGYRLFLPAYDLFFGMGLQHGRRMAVAALDCQPGERVLEVGVGSGLALSLYPRDVHVTGVDISHEMLTKAARRVARARLRQTEGLVQMDAGRLGIASGSFDKAVVMFAVAGLPDPALAMREIERVCRPGATIVVASHFRSRRPLMRLCDTMLSPVHRLLHYRADLDFDRFVADAGLDVVQTRSANLFGYSTILVCRNPQPPVAGHAGMAAAESAVVGAAGVAS